MAKEHTKDTADAAGSHNYGTYKTNGDGGDVCRFDSHLAEAGVARSSG